MIVMLCVTLVMGLCSILIPGNTGEHPGNILTSALLRNINFCCFLNFSAALEDGPDITTLS